MAYKWSSQDVDLKPSESEPRTLSLSIIYLPQKWQRPRTGLPGSQQHGAYASLLGVRRSQPVAPTGPDQAAFPGLAGPRSLFVLRPARLTAKALRHISCGSDPPAETQRCSDPTLPEGRGQFLLCEDRETPVLSGDETRGEERASPGEGTWSQPAGIRTLPQVLAA